MDLPYKFKRTETIVASSKIAAIIGSIPGILMPEVTALARCSAGKTVLLRICILPPVDLVEDADGSVIALDGANIGG